VTSPNLYVLRLKGTPVLYYHPDLWVRDPGKAARFALETAERVAFRQTKAMRQYVEVVPLEDALRP
jgi:hypothetical protein